MTLDDVVKRYPSSRDIGEVHPRGEPLFSARRHERMPIRP
jgi:hypothetical protein